MTGVDEAAQESRLAHPAVDVITDRCALVISQRAVVGVSSWLTDALLAAAGSQRLLVIVTPPTSRVSLPLRTLAAGGLLLWAVRTATGEFYDGVHGTRLTFDGTAFAEQSGGPVPAFTATEAPTSWQLLITGTIEHRAAIQTRLGGALELLAEHTIGRRPDGWGLHEPVSQPWDTAELTTYARRRMPSQTRITVVGAAERTLIATIEAQRTDRGVEEELLLLVEAGPVSPDFTELAAHARAALTAVATAFTVGFMAVHLRPGREDLMSPATMEAAPHPLGIVIGPRAVRGIGRDRLTSAPVPAPRVIGNERVPALAFDVGDGGADPWSQLADLVSHIGPSRLAEATPTLGTVADRPVNG